MKVCFFTDLFYPYLLGGGENRYFELAKRLVDGKDEVMVVTTSLLGQSRNETLENGRLRILRHGFPKHPMDKRSVLSAPGYILSSVLDSHVVDGCDLLDLNTYSSAFAGKIIAFLRDKPCVITMHDVFSPNWLTKHSIYYGFLGTFIEHSISRLHRHGHFITVSEATRGKMIRVLKVPPERIHVVPNGIDFEYIDEIASRTKRHDSDSPKRIVYVGRLVRYKNVDQLIHATKRMLDKGLDVVLDIVGSGGERNSLEGLARQLGIGKRVSFYGFVDDRREVVRFISRADVLVNPSIFEGFGMVLLEAMAARTPVVSYDLPSYNGFAVNGRNAILVQKNNLENLIESVYQVLADGVSTDVVQRGYTIAKNYDWGSIVKRLRNVYENVLEEC